MNPRELVDKFIRLAAHPNTPIDEARNAALNAVKLIAEHKMLDAAPARAAGLGGSPFASIFGGLAMDTMLVAVQEMAVGAGAVEIIKLQNQKLVLERQNASLLREIDRLKEQAMRRADAPMPHREGKRRRRR